MESHQRFEIVLAHMDGYERVKLRGDLDYPTIRRHAEALQELTSLRRKVIIDMSEVTFMDTGGIGVLISVARAGRRAGTRAAPSDTD